MMVIGVWKLMKNLITISILRVILMLLIVDCLGEHTAQIHMMYLIIMKEHGLGESGILMLTSLLKVNLLQNV